VIVTSSLMLAGVPVPDRDVLESQSQGESWTHDNRRTSALRAWRRRFHPFGGTRTGAVTHL